jgi:hypothetical protein
LCCPVFAGGTEGGEKEGRGRGEGGGGRREGKLRKRELSRNTSSTARVACAHGF